MFRRGPPLGKFSEIGLKISYIFKYSKDGELDLTAFKEGLEKLLEHDVDSTYFEDEKAFASIIAKRDFALPETFNSILKNNENLLSDKSMEVILQTFDYLTKQARSKKKWLPENLKNDLSDDVALDLFKKGAFVQIHNGLFVLTKEPKEILNNKPNKHILGIMPAHRLTTLHLADAIDLSHTDTYTFIPEAYKELEKAILKEKVSNV